MTIVPPNKNFFTFKAGILRPRSIPIICKTSVAKEIKLIYIVKDRKMFGFTMKEEF